MPMIEMGPEHNHTDVIFKRAGECPQCDVWREEHYALQSEVTGVDYPPLYPGCPDPFHVDPDAPPGQVVSVTPLAGGVMTESVCPTCYRRWMGFETFTCPRCGKVSHHPQDAIEGYCSACHDWTAGPPGIRPGP